MPLTIELAAIRPRCQHAHRTKLMYEIWLLLWKKRENLIHFESRIDDGVKTIGIVAENNCVVGGNEPPIPRDELRDRSLLSIEIDALTRLVGRSLNAGLSNAIAPDDVPRRIPVFDRSIHHAPGPVALQCSNQVFPAQGPIIILDQRKIRHLPT